MWFPAREGCMVVHVDQYLDCYLGNNLLCAGKLAARFGLPALRGMVRCLSHTAWS